MKLQNLAVPVSIVVGLCATTAFADGRHPGSVLVYPIHRSGPGFFTIISVTNSNLSPATPTSLGGGTNLHFDYVNVVANPANTFLPLDCIVFDRVEYLTPADTLSVMTGCHNATSGGQEGYLVVSAEDPTAFQTRWSHNYLMGSEVVVNPFGAIYILDAIPFTSPVGLHLPTDVNLNDVIDFDGVEYEGIPETLYIDSFIAAAGSSLTLINLSGGHEYTVSVKFDVWNDNEFALSATKSFRCWFEEPLTAVSPLFDQAFLKNNTPSDPNELDINCDGVGDLETGWARINGISASNSSTTVTNPAILGAISAGPVSPFILGGHLLWESSTKQLNGSFDNQ